MTFKKTAGEFIFNAAKNVFKGKKVSGEAIKKFDPKVNTTDLEKAKSKLKIQKHKTKMSGAKLDQTNFEIQNPKFSKGDYTFDPAKKNGVKKRNEGSKKMFRGAQGKAKGGRVGLKFGSKKSNVQKIQETFGVKKKLSPKQMKIAKLAGNPKKIDAQDLAKLRGRG